MNIYFKLNGKEVVPATQDEFCEMWRGSERFLQQTPVGDMTVSTVFLGLDHGFGGEHGIFFETMILNAPGKLMDFQVRYSTYDEAMRGHREALRRARLSLAGRNNRRAVKPC